MSTGRFITEAPGRTEVALSDIGEERERQFAKWGPQHHPDGTPADGDEGQARYFADKARERCDEAAADGRVTWNHILTEEFLEARAESDPAKLRKELVQVAAVCGAWIEDIDSREPVAVADLGGEG